ADMPTMTWAKKGSAKMAGSSPEMARATTPVFLVASACAVRLGVYPRALMARSTASRLARLTCGALLITRDAAVLDTPARSATSASVGCRRGEPVAIAMPRPFAGAIAPEGRYGQDYERQGLRWRTHRCAYLFQ